MMRVMLSLVSLLVVLFIVLKLAGGQVHGSAKPEDTRNAAEQAATKVQKALEQGAAARASDAMAQ
jgi:hypothetical protein